MNPKVFGLPNDNSTNWRKEVNLMTGFPELNDSSVHSFIVHERLSSACCQFSPCCSCRSSESCLPFLTAFWKTARSMPFRSKTSRGFCIYDVCSERGPYLYVDKRGGVNHCYIRFCRRHMYYSMPPCRLRALHMSTTKSSTSYEYSSPTPPSSASMMRYVHSSFSLQVKGYYDNCTRFPYVDELCTP